MLRRLLNALWPTSPTWVQHKRCLEQDCPCECLVCKPTSTRQDSLDALATALREALNHMPTGYPGATNDRNRFVGPVEHVIQELEATSNPEVGK